MSETEINARAEAIRVAGGDLLASLFKVFAVGGEELREAIAALRGFGIDPQDGPLTEFPETCQNGCDPARFPVIEHDEEGAATCSHCMQNRVTNELSRRIEKLEQESFRREVGERVAQDLESIRRGWPGIAQLLHPRKQKP